jgi:peptidyl-prolyl cis-trans isomerase B (cyclophilin B)
MLKYWVYFLLVMVVMSCSRPYASFTTNAFNHSNVVPLKISFKNTSKNAESYLWSFGDGHSSHDINPEHLYSQSGRYKVKLSAIKGSKKTEAYKEIFFYAPNDCHVIMETNMGDMIFKLFESTPKHRDNFIKLIESNYYKEILFHRVIPGFMVQGGDPDSKYAKKGQRLGSGGPAYNIDAEIGSEYYHVKGALAAARQGDNVNPLKKSSASQFYIVTGREISDQQLEEFEEQKDIRYSTAIKSAYLTNGGSPQLDGEYTVFGQIVEGIDVLDKIGSSQTDENDRPLEDIKIINVKVIK